MPAAVQERVAALSAFGTFVGIALAVSAVRVVRPLGVGMMLGALSMGAILALAVS